MREAFEHFGRLDVLVNNAGYSLIATAEETTDEQVQSLFNANYFGVVRVLRAVLPLMRQQRSGHILGVTSSLGVVPAPLIGFYSATKALHETLAKEVAQFGIKVTMIEPGAYATEFGKSATRADAMGVYDTFRNEFMAGLMWSSTTDRLVRTDTQRNSSWPGARGSIEGRINCRRLVFSTELILAVTRRTIHSRYRFFRGN
ncbi:Dehydrogenases with different specificities (related to short-chain alcohol dehydrogenases) [Acidisarcina polymorpha]|uniref:Dehydrogenases with different specificities (Related to short-chain alcohol dehydrogenases) n=1 Tax=Acidisarcina polymorpha TaxID=2211140 RepID=A0A2Z5G912_9BACT|nr:SDR family NAD(P)-dependent oxidoreductase [Acidisarcina polymorpha]AXC15468.1 Dehydrogenases with different specificities (related to short-chain alcohol dehydrogenases) [Acidisarcina polymorpha]